MLRLEHMRRGFARYMPHAALVLAACRSGGAHLIVHPTVARGVAGIVYDSSAHSALANASVEFADATHPEHRPITVQSDSAGGFSVSELPTGRYLATFFHPRLEEVGLVPPTYVVTVAGGTGTWVDLGIPSGTRIHDLYCPASTRKSDRDSTAALVGRVFDAATRNGVSRAAVAVRWQAFDFTNGFHEVGGQSVTALDGSFAICGVPQNIDITVEGSLGAHRTDEIPMRLPPRGVVTRDLLLGERRTVVVHGNVIGSNGGPVPRAHVGVQGLDDAVTADDNGVFALDAPHDGTLMLITRAIGFGVDQRAVNVYRDSAQWVEIALPKLRLLDTVFVRRLRDLDHSGFEDRRAQGAGTFFTHSDIQAMRPTATLDLLRHAPSMNLVQTSPGRAVLRVRGEACLPMLYVDRFPLPPLSDVTEINDLVDVTSIKSAELYTKGLIPREFSRGDPCAALVVWTRR